MVHRDGRYIAAGVQGLIGWEWLVSGANKVLSGTFPGGLASALDEGMKGNPNGWYVAFLQAVVVPHSVLFGYVIEVAELLTGLALLSGAVALLADVRRRGQPLHRLAAAQLIASALAALTCIALCVNFHFFMGDGILPGLNPSGAFDEGIDLDTLIPPMALLVLWFNLYVLSDAMGVALSTLPRRAARQTLAFVAHARVALGAADAGAL